jgi:hypothetical protein
LPLSRVIALVSLAFHFFPRCSAGEEAIGDFALRLRGMIVSGDEAAFRKLGCYPASCVDDDDVAFVFGKKESQATIRRLLSNPAVEVKVFGPFTYSDELKDSSYVVMYYDPEIVKFDPYGRLSQEQRENLWWKGYVETVVSPVGSGWGFHRTPFHNGADPPWLGDY